MTDRPTTPPLRAVRMAANCPICGKPGATNYRPFCSKRSAHIDLGQWFGGKYKIETDEAPDDEEQP